MPGSLPVEEEADGLIILHALDVEQRHAAQMAEHEVRFAAAVGGKSARCVTSFLSPPAWCLRW